MFYYLALLLPCCVSLFWSATLGFGLKHNNRSQNIWILTCLVLAVSTFIWALFFAGVDDYGLFYKLETLEAFTTLLLLPLLYFCFKSLTVGSRLGWKSYVWLSPAFIILLSMVCLYASMGEGQAVEYIRKTVEGRGEIAPMDHPSVKAIHIISAHIYKWVVIAQAVGLLVYATFSILRYRHRLREFFSDLGDKSLNRIYSLLGGLYAVLFLSLGSYKGRFQYAGYIETTAILMLCWGVLIYFMGYNVYKLHYTAQTLAHDLERADLEAAEQGYGPANDDAAETGKAGAGRKRRELHEAFERLMENDKVFLQKNLRMDQLARMLHTNRTYISRIINEDYGCSFSDYINRKRIEYACSIMRSDNRITQEQVAEKSGFTQASSFSRAFKQYAGITFREWQKINS